MTFSFEEIMPSEGGPFVPPRRLRKYQPISSDRQRPHRLRVPKSLNVPIKCNGGPFDKGKIFISQEEAICEGRAAEGRALTPTFRTGDFRGFYVIDKFKRRTVGKERANLATEAKWMSLA